MSAVTINIVGQAGWCGFREKETLLSAVHPYLKDRKLLKLMSVQDQLSLVCASRAVAEAGLSEEELKLKTGIYMTMGYASFEDNNLHTLVSKCEHGGAFSMQRFSSDAMRAINPLLTFKCLPNMALHHVSRQLQIHGPYFVTYPGTGQWFQCLQRALDDMRAGRVNYALVGAAAYQENTLVQSQIQCLYPNSNRPLSDAAAFWVLSKAKDSNVLASITQFSIAYQAVDPFIESTGPCTLHELFSHNLGPAEAQIYLTDRIESRSSLAFEYQSKDGITALLDLEVS